MNKTKIDWCDSTWNPVTGCLHGCEYCCARNIAHRFGGWTDSDGDMHHDEILKNESMVRELDEPLQVFREGQTIFSGKWQKAPYPYDFIPTFHRYRLDDYIGKKGRNIFVCSMADLFGSWVPDSWIIDVMNSCLKNPDNNYLFLTKNPKRYKEHYIPRDFATLWFGTTITRKVEINRVYEMVFFRNKFVSIEPIMEDLELKYGSRFFLCTDWVIIGAETGRRKDKVIPKRKWIEDIVNACREKNIPVFMKSSFAEIWGEPLIQDFPKELKRS